MRKDVLVRQGIGSNITVFGIDIITKIPSINPTSTCLHAKNPQATAIVLKWRTFQKLILLPGPEKNLRAAAKKV